MYFVALPMRLKLMNKEMALGIADGVYAHKAIMATFSRIDPDLGRTLHDLPRNKPLTIAIVKSEPGAAILRVTFMGEKALDYANLLMSELSTRPELKLGYAIGHVESLDLGDPTWGGMVSWADLVAAPPQKQIRLHFITPTAITKRDALNIRFTALFPDPVDIFSNLARRWRELAGPAIPIDIERFIESGGCVISGHKLSTVEFTTRDRTQLGFVGQVQYQIRWPDQTEYVTALGALSRLAQFTGIGYQTPRGMGAIRVTLT